MNGTLIPHTPIAVDFWKIRECPQARIFFLTHLHGDHITGLTSSWCFPIYCSEITGKLLLQRYGIKEDLIHPLQTESAEIIYLDNEKTEQMTVTAIEANHCPGAVMFLMQGYFGTILHTGDFRYHPDMINQSIMSDLSGKVDLLYLDNTYCSPGCVFPTKEEATTQVIEIIEKHPNKDVLIAMRNLGKENLLCKIAVHFQEWISVPDKFYRTLEILEAPNVFDTGSNNHRIRVVPFHKISNKFVETVNQERETIVILPTALYRGIDCTPYENNENVFVVPYSDHSSYSELIDFVSFIKPKKIIPIVKSNARGPFGLSIAERANMACFDKFTSNGWNSRIEIPISVQAFMYCNKHKVFAEEYKGQKRKMKQRQPQTKKLKRGIAYDSPISASKQKGRPVSSSKRKGIPVSATKQTAKSPLQVHSKETLTNKCNKENSENVGNDLPHVRQLLFDKIAVNGSKVNSIQIEKEETGKGNNIENCDVIKIHSDKQQRLISKQQEENQSFDQQEVSDESLSRDSQDRNRRNTREKLSKRTAGKEPLQFVSANQDSAFEIVLGRRTYGRTNKKFLNRKDIIMLKTIEMDEDSKLNETAKWVLESSQSKDDEKHLERVSDDSEYNDRNVSVVCKIINHDIENVTSRCEGNSNDNQKSIVRKNTENSEFVVKSALSSRKKSGGKRKPEQNGKQNNKEESVIGGTKGDLNISGDLKQSVITQYVIKAKTNVKSNPKMKTRKDQKVYHATKLHSDAVEVGKSLSGKIIDVNHDEQIIVGEFVKEISQPNSNEPKENSEETHDCEQIERKRYSNDGNAKYAEEEHFVVQDTFDESLIAQIGTQVRYLNVSIDSSIPVSEKNRTNYVVKPSHEKNGKVGRLDQQSQVDNSGVCTDKSISFLDNRSEGNKAHDCINVEVIANNDSSEIIDADKVCEEEDFSTCVNKGSQEKAIVTDGNKSTLSKADKEALTYSYYDANMSTRANIKSQREVLTLENTDRIDTETETNYNQGETQTEQRNLNKMEREVEEYKISNCRQCELDAFEQVFDELGSDKLDKVVDSSSTPKENQDINQYKCSTRYKARCRQVVKCLFSVKPINIV